MHIPFIYMSTARTYSDEITMSRVATEYHVHIISCLHSDVLSICNVLRTILANEESAHTISRPPIFSSNSIQMAHDLLQDAHDNNHDTAREITHVLPGSHNMCFKLHYEHDDATGMIYRVTFCYRDKHPSPHLNPYARSAKTKQKRAHVAETSEATSPISRDKRCKLGT